MGSEMCIRDSSSIRYILDGYAPRDEQEARIYGMKRGLEFIANRQNTITEENLHATIRTFVMKFHEMGLLTARKAGNRVFYRVGGTSDGRPL